MSVTVSDLLKLPSLQQARVIGGAGGLKKVVSSISVLESTDPGVLINEVFRHNKYPGSEIVITGFLNCINDVERQCSNLLRLIEGGEVGMVLYYVGVYLPRVDRRLIEIANANDFVLICMPEGQRHLRYSDLITDVTECIYRDRLVPGSLVSDILARISTAPHHQQTVGTALQMLCAELGCSAALTTHEGNILNLATWPSGMEDTVREGIERCLPLLTEQICVRRAQTGVLLCILLLHRLKKRTAWLSPRCSLMKLSKDVGPTLRENIPNFLLCQSPAERAAGFERRIIGSVGADHALAHEVQPRVAAILLPSAHPFAIAPSVGAEQCRALAAEAALAGIEHRLELHFLQHLAAHGGAAEGDGIVGVQIAGGDLGGREQHSLCARGGHALGNGTRHRLRIARTAPINNSSFHFC